MRLCKAFSIAISITMTLATLAQNATYVYADQDSQGFNVTGDSKKPIYHIALTPWESRSIGIDDLNEAMSEHEKNLAQTESYQSAMGIVIALTAAGASAYYVKTSDQAYRGAKSWFEEFLFQSYSVYEAYFGEGGDDIDALHRDDTHAVLRGEVREEMRRNPRLTAGAVVASGALVGSLLSQPIIWLDNVLIQKWTFPTEKVDRNKIEAAFEIAQSHADNSCGAFDGYKAKIVQKSALQSKHFSKEDFDQGRVYLDGVRLSEDDFIRSTGSRNTLDEAVYVFNDGAIHCRTGYITSTSLSDLMLAAR